MSWLEPPKGCRNLVIAFDLPFPFEQGEHPVHARSREGSVRGQDRFNREPLAGRERREDAFSQGHRKRSLICVCHSAPAFMRAARARTKSYQTIGRLSDQLSG